MRKLKLVALGMVWAGLAAGPARAGASDFQVFNDRESYSGVLLQQGRVTLDADWNEEDAGPIHPGQAFGNLRYDFNPSVIQPVVGAGIVSGLAVGAAPDGTLGGDQGLSLDVSPGLGLTAFGVAITVGAFDGLLSDVFRLEVGCPLHCVFAGNTALGGADGSSLFIGIVGPPELAFDQVTIEAVTPRDGDGEPIDSVPAWQIAAITFSPVPEPATALLLAAAVGLLGFRRRSRGKLVKATAPESETDWR